MMFRYFGALLIALAFIFAANSAQAIGFYADAPLKFTFSDCDNNCSYTPSGLKAGVILPINLGLGIESYKISDDGTEVKFDMLDVSYLLPIPIVNITLGIGGGSVGLSSGGDSESGGATQIWASFGYTIAAIFDLHVGYHQVSAAIHEDAFTFNADGTMLSAGVMVLF